MIRFLGEHQHEKRRRERKVERLASSVILGRIFVTSFGLSEESSLDRVEATVRVSENCPVRRWSHVVFGHEGLASGDKLVELIVIDPSMPAPLNLELHTPGRAPTSSRQKEFVNRTFGTTIDNSEPFSRPITCSSNARAHWRSHSLEAARQAWTRNVKPARATRGTMKCHAFRNDMEMCDGL